MTRLFIISDEINIFTNEIFYCNYWFGRAGCSAGSSQGVGHTYGRCRSSRPDPSPCVIIIWDNFILYYGFILIL